MRVIILTTDRKVKRKGVRPGASSFTHKRKMFELDPRAVFMTEWPGKSLKKSKPTLFYFENSPGPIRHIEKDKDRPDDSAKYLEKHIRVNAVSQQSSPSLGSRLGPIVEALGPYVSFYNIFILIVAGPLIWAWLTGVLLG